ncbi:hypothetical protein HWI79_2978 [Cryptosporidium felis]|nr:hypothetical protein HWI79_2978 [Cryptosporidium felis]
MNSSKSQDSFESCYSSLFDNSQDTEVNSLQETLNSKVFLIPSSFNDIWLLEQINQLKLLTQRDEIGQEFDDSSSNDSSLNEQATPDESPSSRSEDERSENSSESLKSMDSSKKLSDIVNNKLFSNWQQNVISDEDNILISELENEVTFGKVSDTSSQTSSRVLEGLANLTQDEIDGIKEILISERNECK